MPTTMEWALAKKIVQGKVEAGRFERLRFVLFWTLYSCFAGGGVASQGLV